MSIWSWLAARANPEMVNEAEALAGRDTPVLDPIPTHEIFGIKLDGFPPGSQVAYFALGCYWGEEKMFWQTPGVVNTAVGFMGGYTPNPTYDETCTGKTGHTETVQVVFDPNQISYQELLTKFWQAHDPTQKYRQGNDVGTQYRSAIFPVNAAQQRQAEASRETFQRNLTAAGYGEITTEITVDQQFYYAEAEHQQYLAKNPNGYCPSHATGVEYHPAPQT